MPLSVGQARTDPTTGISARVWFGLTSRSSYSGMSAAVFATSPPTNATRDIMAAITESVAEGMYSTLVTDAAVEVVVPANAFGAGIPPAPVTLTGRIL